MTPTPDVLAGRPPALRFPAPSQHFLGLAPDQANFATRGFSSTEPARRLSLEGIGRIFIDSYNVALTTRRVDQILQYTGGIPPRERGYAVEGAAFGIAIADALPWRRSCLADYIDACQSDFPYLVHVGAGWALARVPWRRRRILARLDPLLRPLASDGLGFHDTYFHHRHVLAGWRRCHSGHDACAYDQGVGRALWFVGGGSVATAASHVEALPATRRRDLWAGLGLAMAYAGPTHDVDLVFALRLAGPFQDCFAQGVAFACEARARAGHVPAHTELAACVVWNQDARALAAMVREARDRTLAIDKANPRYELWRRRIMSMHPSRSARESQS